MKRVTRKGVAILLTVVMLIGQWTMVMGAQTTDYLSSWASQEISEWLAKGWVRCYEDGSFRPNQSITRAEFVEVVNNAFTVPETSDEPKFSDVKVTDAYYEDVARAQAAGYIGGYPDGTFRPDGSITRQEVAKILAEMLGLNNYHLDLVDQFKDGDKLGDWAKAAVSGLVAYDIMKGYPDSTFRQNKEMSRAEAVVVLKRAYESLAGLTGIEIIVSKDAEAVEGATVQLYKQDGTWVNTTMTNEKGIAEFINLNSGKYYVVASTEKDIASTATYIEVKEEFKTIVSLHMLPAVEVTGVLVDSNYKRAPKGIVLFFEEGNYVMKTNEEGVFKGLLPAQQKYRVSIYDKGLKPIGEVIVGGESIDLGTLRSEEIFIALPGDWEGKKKVKTYAFEAKAEEGGKIVSPAKERYKAGEIVELEAVADEGYMFKEWIATQGGSFSNAISSQTSFTMPAADTQVKACFVPETIGEVIEPVLELLEDNGTLKFGVMPVQKEHYYTLNVRHNEKAYQQVVGVENSFEIAKPSEVGVYSYSVTVTNGVDSKKSNEVSYMITATGSGPIDQDTDGDGLSDELENELGTDIYSMDTDEDGLPDGYEYHITTTSPLSHDTDGDGVSDGEEDLDADNLSNSVEYQLGTNPLHIDTDGDNLSDRVEQEVYGTNPLVQDTDGDGLLDYDEILLGFNPLLADTDSNGILDSEEELVQKIDEVNTSEELVGGNEAVPTVRILTKGNMNRTVALTVSKDIGYAESRAIVGRPVEISGVEFEYAELTFALDESIANALYLICGYDAEGNTVFYETDYDATNHSLSAEITQAASYFVLEVETLFAELGLELPRELRYRKEMSLDVSNEVEHLVLTEEELKSMSNGMEWTTSSMIEVTTDAMIQVDRVVLPELLNKEMAQPGAVGQADIVFIIDTTGSMGDEINNVKNNIAAFVEALKEKGISPSLGLIDYQDITVDGLDSTKVHKNGNKNWFIDIEQYKDELAGLKLGYGGDIAECAVDALETARRLDMRGNAQKFFILVTDAEYKVENNYGISSMEEEIELLMQQKVSVSVVTSKYLKSTYSKLFMQTEGIFADINNRNFKEELMVLADKIGEDVVEDGVWIHLQGPVPKVVKVKEIPTAGSLVDSDEDGVIDSEELESVIPVGIFDLDELIDTAAKGTVSKTSYGVVRSYKYKSNPAEVDTDGDGYPDDQDLAPKVKFRTPVILLHGRGDNSADCFGVVTAMHDEAQQPQNGHYNAERSLSGKDYTFVTSHTIKDTITSTGEKTPKNLGYTLDKIQGYTINNNLFAFNYPNQDMTQKNAAKLKGYLENLANYMFYKEDNNLFYPTKISKDNKDYKVNLIGHSNGGLVSRYFIENMGGSSKVDKLVTIDTPHWGSGLADISDNFLAIDKCFPMDVDLNPNNAIFGGEIQEYKDTFLSKPVKEKIKYINANQTPELRYEEHGATEYYFIAGYDAASSKDVPISYLNKNIGFNIDGLKELRPDIDTFEVYNRIVRESFVNNSKYPELAENIWFDDVLDLKLSDGDNVVNNQSQLGVKFRSDKKKEKLKKIIRAEAAWMNIDTFMGHWEANHFHSENQHRKETIDKVMEYLR